MRTTTYALPDTPDPTGSTTPAGHGWVDTVWTQIAGGASPYLIALAAALVGGIAVYLLMRRPGKTDFSKHLMYVPLLLVNAAAIYGQVAFFYDQVAPEIWPGAGKVALAVILAAAIESVAVYVGWHAHDALLMKAGVTAARLRRASYLVAGFVGTINYAHFADDGMRPTAASFAFGLLSLLSPWLWGLHTRRAQHVQLLTEGVIDGSGATFSAERVRMFPFRTHMARRWSVDNNVSDPDAAWEGYKAHRATRVRTGFTARVHLAWIVLTGQASHPGPVRVTSAGLHPGAGVPQGPDATLEIGPGETRALEAGTAADENPDTETGTAGAGNPGTETPSNPGAKTARKPAQTRASSTLQTRARRPSNAQVKAEKLRATNPGMPVAEIARRVNANEKTVRVWFKATDSGDDDAKERVPSPGPQLVFDPPKELVTAGVNGYHPTPAEEN